MVAGLRFRAFENSRLIHQYGPPSVLALSGRMIKYFFLGIPVVFYRENTGTPVKRLNRYQIKIRARSKMADQHPYIASQGPLIKIVNHFRNSFPSSIDAKTLKKAGLAPNNESYAINIMRFVGMIDEDGNKTVEAAKVFTQHDDKEFQKSFGTMVKDAYSDLFETHGGGAWELGEDSLITFFRAADQTTAIVGKRQAGTFLALSSLAGHRDMPVPKAMSSADIGKGKAKKKETTKKVSSESAKSGKVVVGNQIGAEFNQAYGLTVRIEINLPLGGDKSTYDAIFRSIRENLLNAK